MKPGTYFFTLMLLLPFTLPGADLAAAHYREKIQPILTEYCYDCHGDGEKKGGIALDEFKSDTDITTNSQLWFAVLKNVRAGLMPPESKPRPTADEQKKLADWIKYDAFGINPNRLEAGRPIIRRLNRAEYRNTIRDLLGINYNTQEEFPADDTGFGFDNIGEVLTLSPMLMEKYVNAAETIVNQAVPVEARTLPERSISSREMSQRNLASSESIFFTNRFDVPQAGHYTLDLDFVSPQGRRGGPKLQSKLALALDGVEFASQIIGKETHPIHFEFNTNLTARKHELVVKVEPLQPATNANRLGTLRLQSAMLRGPQEKQFWQEAKNYRRFFPKEVPAGSAERASYAGELLRSFASRAFRHPVGNETLDRLTALAKDFYEEPGRTFEAGVAHAMEAVLASPEFLFVEEGTEIAHRGDHQSPVSEYALASRLSYFLWSSLPDDELFRLAAAGELRKNLPGQIKRMLADPRSEGLVENFTGQWLQARDIENVGIDPVSIMAREQKIDHKSDTFWARYYDLSERPAARLSEPDKIELARLEMEKPTHVFRARGDFSGEMRHSMHHEVELYFSGIMHEDRSINELVESDYTYLNGLLARQYALTNLHITGAELRRVTLPPDSPRGGVLTMGAVLAVTSNPTRTSPVKRGLFVLDNILGTPTPPPPPNIPPLEDSEKKAANHEATLREALELHRSKPLCNSCHSRMDPLGLAFENFNAMGMWRNQEHEQDILPAGKLITGESFQNIRELKHILITKHQVDFYRTLTEKMLTYALGRGLEYYDVETVDRIVENLQKTNGRFSVLLDGIIESTPFQQRRNMDVAANTK